MEQKYICSGCSNSPAWGLDIEFFSKHGYYLEGVESAYPAMFAISGSLLSSSPRHVVTNFHTM